MWLHKWSFAPYLIYADCVSIPSSFSFFTEEVAILLVDCFEENTEEEENWTYDYFS